MRAPSRFVGALAALLCGCAATGPLPKPTAMPKTVAPPPAPKPPKERLLGLLRAVERPAPILELLPADALATLDLRLKGLTAEQREQLTSGELGRVMPLLHFRAGGSSKDALFALASTPVAAEELPLVFSTDPQASLEQRRRAVQLTQAVVERSALHFLRDRVLDVASAPAAQLPAVLGDVERMARSAGRPDIVRLALETWAASGAPVEVLARLGQACAYDSDEKCFQQAQSGVPETAPEQARLGRLKKALALRNDGDPIVKAWALLELGRYSEARVAIAPVEGKAKQDLRVAAAIAVATSLGSACPGITMASAALLEQCADAQAVRPGLTEANANMDAAWASGAGRDAVSTEAYVGLAHVVPWMMTGVRARDPAALEREFRERYEALSSVLAELPQQRPFAVFAATFAAGVLAGSHAQRGERPQIDGARKQELWFGALGLEAPAPRLAVSAVLAADQPVLPLVPPSATPELVPARAGLLAWEAANAADDAPLEGAKAALGEQLVAAAKGSFEAATAVLLLAELDALKTPSERSHKALAQVSSQLIGEPLPPELALRAVLDAAGALERLGRPADALGVLGKAAEIQAPPGPASDMLTLIRAEKLVLEWDAKSDPRRVALAKALAGLQSSAGQPSIGFVLGAYAAAKPAKSAGSVQERLGVRTAQLLRQGALGGARVSLSVSYSFEGGLSPQVRFEPMLVPLVRPDLIQKAL
jgi:tetratricopeptide (TPR) repeat protein